jgi:hypothetical protein
MTDSNQAGSNQTPLTFRDFAGAVMTGNLEAAGQVLAQLLELPGPRAAQAAGHFQQQSTEQGPGFMMKAMGLRTAVTSGDDAQIAKLLGECFGLAGADLSGAVQAIRRRYG